MKRIFRFLLLIFVLVTFLGANSFAYRYYNECDYETPFIYDAYWDYKVARWSVDGHADKYEIILYRDGYRVTTQITYNRSFDCYSYMSRRGYEYYFEVRPYNYRTGWGTWVSSNWNYVDDYDYREYDYRRESYSRNYNNRNYARGDVSYAKNPGPPINVDNSGTTNNFVSGNVVVQSVDSQNVTVPTPQIVYDITFGIIPMGSFIKTNGVWKYLYLNGVQATNTWVMSNGKWYYLDISGNMVTGLYTINGKTYYFNQDGSMQVGNANINGITHYFDANGVMVY